MIEATDIEKWPIEYQVCNQLFLRQIFAFVDMDLLRPTTTAERSNEVPRTWESTAQVTLERRDYTAKEFSSELGLLAA